MKKKTKLTLAILGSIGFSSTIISTIVLLSSCSNETNIASNIPQGNQQNENIQFTKVTLNPSGMLKDWITIISPHNSSGVLANITWTNNDTIIINDVLTKQQSLAILFSPVFMSSMINEKLDPKYFSEFVAQSGGNLIEQSLNLNKSTRVVYFLSEDAKQYFLQSIASFGMISSFNGSDFSTKPKLKITGVINGKENHIAYFDLNITFK